ncbi:MAG TPA: MFS transporter [Candidatus Saccharimonadales bacterium]|nr:MFS transporter [Candidatus Saccharimonadales bacterium]
MKQKSKWLVFSLVGVAQFMVILDVCITNMALPAIKEALHFNTSSLQWVVTAYALAFGGFLLLGGRAADLFGRRRILVTGMVAFTVLSLLIGASSSSLMIIILRALQGVAAALMSPAALSIVLTTFKEGAERNRALGYWTIVSTGGAAIGLLLGGVLTQYANWRWNFFINVPIGVVVAYAIAKIVPKHEQEAAHRDLDLPGALLVTSGLIAFVYAISQAPTVGWLAGSTIGTIVLAAALIAGFLYNESRSKHPLMPLSIFKIRNVTGGNLVMAPVYAGQMGMFFLLSLYIQDVMRYSPAQAGLAFLPFPIVLGLVSPRVSRWVSKHGYKRFLIVGPLVIAATLLWLTRLTPTSSYWLDVLPTILLMPIGVGMTFMPTMAAATSGVPGNEAGLASGLLNTSQQMGGALGLAILSGVAASVAAGTHGSPVAALVHGYDRAFLVASFMMMFAALLAATVIKQQKRAKANHQVAVEAGM